MAHHIPAGITRDHVIGAISDYNSGVIEHRFGPSLKYDLLHEGRRYPPKAILGLAARYVIGHPLAPDDFPDGEKSKNLRILRDLDFEIVRKGNDERRTPPQRNVAGYIIQGNPKLYDIDGYFSRQDFIYWNCPQFVDTFRLGMPIFFKRSGPGGGIVARGQVAELPTRLSDVARPSMVGEDLWIEPPDHDVMKVGVILLEKRLRPVDGLIPTKLIGTLPELAAHPINTFRQGTIFRLSADQTIALLSLWGSDQNGLGGDGAYGTEGRRREIRHFRIERNSLLVRQKKSEFATSHGFLACEVCGFRYDHVYPQDLADGFIEAHHIRPLAQLDEDTITTLDDLILVCANCHRMVHRNANVESNLTRLRDHFTRRMRPQI